jgi:tripartite-type tricarboxylate transporter receptor subunit TctC
LLITNRIFQYFTKIMNRSLIRICLPALLVSASLFCSSAIAQAWPTKTVRIVVPFAPGGTSDTLGRLVAKHLGESLKQPVVVENRPGAGGVVGSDMVAKAAPDGYTLVVSGVASHAIAPSLSKKFAFDPIQDFSHIALFGGPPNVIAVNTSVPARDVKEFVTYAKSQQGKISYGSPGNGTQGHLFAEHFKQLVGVDMTHIPYKGAAPAVTDLMGGHIPVVSTSLSTAMGQIKAGKARPLGISARSRLPDLPDVPTFTELGYPDLVATTWFSLSGPAGMPKEIVQRLNAEVRRILQLPEVREKLQADGIEPNNLDPQATTAFIAGELKRWAPVVRASGMKVD